MARFRFVAERSSVTIDATSSLHPIHTTSDGLEGYVDLEVGTGGEVKAAASPVGELTFPVSRLRSGNAMEDRELYKRVDVRRYPTIGGVLEDLGAPAADGSFVADGTVTFRGVARHYRNPLGIKLVDDRTVELSGSSRFDIRDFGMEPPKVLMLKVHPEVDVTIDVVAEKEE